jgi:hypothetical protein
MTRFHSAIIVSAMLGGAVTVSAQAPASDRPQTISGCLQRAENGTFVMTNVDLPSGSAASTASTSGSSGSKLPVIGLIPPSVSLRKFVDQRVEVAAILRDSPTQPGTPAVEIADITRLPSDMPPVKSIGGSCK